MAEPTVRIVWCETDWPQGRPTVQAGHPYAALAGVAPQQAVLAIDHPFTPGMGLDDLLTGLLTTQARAAIDQGKAGVAVFGRRARPGMMLHPDDRVELLGPLQADPQAARRHRVRQARDVDPRHLWRPRG